jgi:hypothetical protein
MSYKLDDDLRISILNDEVINLQVSTEYCFLLLSSINKYREQILARPVFQEAGLWDDLEALQQVTLGDTMEEKLKELFGEEQS